LTRKRLPSRRNRSGAWLSAEDSLAATGTIPTHQEFSFQNYQLSPFLVHRSLFFSPSYSLYLFVHRQGFLLSYWYCTSLARFLPRRAASILRSLAPLVKISTPASPLVVDLLFLHPLSSLLSPPEMMIQWRLEALTLAVSVLTRSSLPLLYGETPSCAEASPAMGYS